jgi:hypothetical protein
MATVFCNVHRLPSQHRTETVTELPSYDNGHWFDILVPLRLFLCWHERDVLCRVLCITPALPIRICVLNGYKWTLCTWLMSTYTTSFPSSKFSTQFAMEMLTNFIIMHSKLKMCFTNGDAECMYLNIYRSRNINRFCVKCKLAYLHYCLTDII